MIWRLAAVITEKRLRGGFFAQVDSVPMPLCSRAALLLPTLSGPRTKAGSLDQVPGLLAEHELLAVLG